MTNMTNPVLKNVESGQIIEIVKSPFTLGRGLVSDYVIEHKIISRKHCSLEKTNDGWIVTDSSTNGTLVNDEHYQGKSSSILQHGDEINLGVDSIKYKFFLQPEPNRNCPIERLRNEEYTPGPSCDLPVSPCSFDENGISDDLLNNIADGILAQENENCNNAAISHANGLLHNVPDGILALENKNYNIAANWHQSYQDTINPSKSEQNIFTSNQPQCIIINHNQSDNNAIVSNQLEQYNVVSSQPGSSELDSDQLKKAPNCTTRNQLESGTAKSHQSKQFIVCSKQPESSTVNPGQSESNCIIPDQLEHSMLQHNVASHHSEPSSSAVPVSTETMKESTIVITDSENNLNDESISSVSTLCYSLPEDFGSVNTENKDAVFRHSTSGSTSIKVIDNAPNRKPVDNLSASIEDAVRKFSNNNNGDTSCINIENKGIGNNSPGINVKVIPKSVDNLSTTIEGVVKKYSDDSSVNVSFSNQSSVQPSTSGVSSFNTSKLINCSLLPQHSASSITSPLNANKKIKVVACSPDVLNTLRSSSGQLLPHSQFPNTLAGNLLRQFNKKDIERLMVTAKIPLAMGAPPLLILGGSPTGSSGRTLVNNSETNRDAESGAILNSLPVPVPANGVEIGGSNMNVVSCSKVGTVEANVVPGTRCHDSQEPGTSKVAAKMEVDKAKQKEQNQFEEMEDELMCTICANLFVKAVTLGCSHSFCQYCIDTWKKKKSDCPICRNKITSTTRTIVLDNIIEKMMENAPEADKEARKQSVEERKKIEEDQKAKENKNKQNVNNGGRNTGRRGRGRNLRQNRTNNAGNNQAPQRAPEVPVITIADSPSSTDSDSDSNSNSYDGDYDYDNEGWSEEYDYYDGGYTGVPGRYYGGYGSCYNCGERGHWSNGCPYR